ncbi:MAG: endonuclease [Bacteroidaceae bacterium]|nr:endonuclease [Bacteroidaceae bacterium]
MIKLTKRILSLTLLIVVLGTQVVLAQPKSYYYNTIDGLKKEQLKIALGKILKNHEKRSYDDLKTDYKAVYVVPGTKEQVWDIFSDAKYNYSSGGWNREHVVANSWWGGAKNSAYSDLFSVIPSESTANNHKSNYPPAELTNNVKYDHGRIKVGTPKSGMGGAYKNAFEPYDEFKGDFARIYFYVATCYDDIAWGSGNVDSEINRNTWPTLEPWLYQMLVRWHNLDPVSDMEKQINNAVEKIQGNRNPFIDYPVLVDLIWNEDYFNTAFDLDNATLYQHVDGSGTIGGDEGDDDDDDDDDGGDEKPDTTIVVDGELIQGEIIFADYFDAIEDGNSNETGGSSTPWTEGDEWFASTGLSTAYQAGGAVRLGTGKKAGSITSNAIQYDGGPLIVEISVKGWTTIEGKLVVTVDGQTQTVDYSSTISDEWETIRLEFNNVSANPTITIATDTKRCFIDSVVVYSATVKTVDSIDDILSDSTANHNRVAYDIYGRRVNINSPLLPRGIYIVGGKKMFIK